MNFYGLAHPLAFHGRRRTAQAEELVRHFVAKVSILATAAGSQARIRERRHSGYVHPSARPLTEEERNARRRRNRARRVRQGRLAHV